jgi:hypothetical protein
MSRQTKFMHRHLPTGHSVTIGYEFPDDHIGEVKIAFAFKSPKDQFSKHAAHTVIRKCFAEGDYITVIQNNDKHIIDIVVDVFNDAGKSKMPESWKKHFPEGIILRKTVTLEPVSISFKAAKYFSSDLIDQAQEIAQEVLEETIYLNIAREEKEEIDREMSPLKVTSAKV